MINEKNIMAVALVLVWAMMLATSCSDSRPLPSEVKDASAVNETSSDYRQWKIEEAPYPINLDCVFSFGEEHYYVGSGGSVLEHEGGDWKILSNIIDGQESEFLNISSLWATATNDLYAATYSNGLFHWDGLSWEKIPQEIPGGFGNKFLDIFGLSGNAIFASGFEKSFVSYDGNKWKSFVLTTDEISPGSLVAVWPVREDWVLFATQGAVYRWDGSKGDALFRLDEGFVSVWAADENDVFAATTKTAVRYKDGRLETTPWPINERSHIYDIWGFSSDEVYAVGEGINTSESLVLRFDGSSWQQVDTGTNIETLFDVTGDKDGNLYAVSGDGQVLIGLRR